MPRPYVKINSADRLNPTTTTPAQFTIASTVPLTGLSLKAIYLPVTCYNVATGINSSIYFTDTQARVANIAPGFHSGATTFMTAVSDAMTAASGGAGVYSCTLNAVTQLLNISCTIPFSLTFSNTQGTSSEMLGFRNVDTATATSQTATAVLNLTTTLCYNISINGAQGAASLSGASASFVIPALTTTPSNLYYEVSLTMPQSITFQSSKHLDIAIYDDTHRLLNMQSNFYMICSVIEA